MAGIGFELRRVITMGSLAASFNATLSGIMIVAGPWLLTIVTIFVIRQVFQAVHMADEALFQAAAIYCYAVSLSVFSAVHFLFIRLVADLIWVKDERVAAGWLGWFSIAVAGLSIFLGVLALAWMPLPELAHPTLFKLAVVGLFTSVNLLWLAMLFVSLLRQYGRILVVYLVGMVASVGLVAWWGGAWGVGGAVLGFAIGHLAIVGALLTLCWREFPPLWAPAPWSQVFLYVKKCRLLILSGLFFYLGQWIDKMVFWFSRGASIEGSAFHLFPDYDLPVYFAGLTIIPGLVYFVIFLETAFYSALQKFMNSLLADTYSTILKSRFHLMKTMNEELRDQMVFQGIFTAAAAALVFWVFPGLSWPLMILAMIGAFFQLLLMTFLNLMYYLELFPQAFVGAAVFLGGQGVLALGGVFFPALAPGVGFLVSAMAACLVSYLLLSGSIRTVDRAIFIRSSS